MSGIEQAYEEVLRGVKGVKIEMVDVHGVPQGSYANGIYDTLASPGVAITCTIDARLQALAEELMEGKVGSVVAIEPETGEILVMASSPTYDPDELVGRERGNNYMETAERSTQTALQPGGDVTLPPGSTFKVLQGLIGLQGGGACSRTNLPVSWRIPLWTGHEMPRPQLSPRPDGSPSKPHVTPTSVTFSGISSKTRNTKTSKRDSTCGPTTSAVSDTAAS